MRLSRFIAASTAAAIAVALLAAITWTSPSASALETDEAAFLALINQYRSDNGQGQLFEDAGMQVAAEWLANDMATNDYMSHTDSLNRGMTERLQALISPYNYSAWGENIAAGYQNAAAVFGGWSNSPGHNANMLSSNYNVIGIAKVCMAGTTYGCYWATDFGHVASPVTPSPTTTSSATPTPTPTPTPTSTPTPTGTATATATATPTSTATATATPTSTPTSTGTATPTQTVAPPLEEPVPTDGQSILLAPLSPGDKNLTLASAENLGLQPGDVIVINPGGENEEVHTIQGLDPLSTANGMALPHAAGEIVVRVNSGDVNCDGVVDELDTLILLRIVGGLSTTGLCVAVADVNCDEKTGADDALRTLRRGALQDSNSGSASCEEVGGPVRRSTTLTEESSIPQGGSQPQGGSGQFLRVSDAEGFEVGDSIRINPGGETEEENTIVGIESNVLEMRTVLQFDHEADEQVIRVIWTPRLSPPKPSPTPSPTPTSTPTATPTPTAAMTPTPTPSPSPTPAETEV